MRVALRREKDQAGIKDPVIVHPYVLHKAIPKFWFRSVRFIDTSSRGTAAAVCCLGEQCDTRRDMYLGEHRGILCHDHITADTLQVCIYNTIYIVPKVDYINIQCA